MKGMAEQKEGAWKREAVFRGKSERKRECTEREVCEESDEKTKALVYLGGYLSERKRKESEPNYRNLHRDQ